MSQNRIAQRGAKNIMPTIVNILYTYLTNKQKGVTKDDGTDFERRRSRGNGTR